MGKMLPGTSGALRPGRGERGLPKVGLPESGTAAPAELLVGFGSPWLMLLAGSELRDFLFHCLQLLKPKVKVDFFFFFYSIKK